MKRPRTAVIPPEYLETGAIGEQTASTDEYFRSIDEATLRIIIDNFMDKIPEPQRSAVQMCIMSRMTYEQAAEILTLERGIQTDRKTVWRWAQQGKDMMGRMLEAARWTSAMSPKVPNDG